MILLPLNQSSQDFGAQSFVLERRAAVLLDQLLLATDQDTGSWHFLSSPPAGVWIPEQGVAPYRGKG